MNCRQYQELISAHLDNELPNEQREPLESHLRACEACRRELEEFTAIKEHLTMIEFKEPSDAELERYWSSVYNRLERGLAWILVSLGAIVLLCWGAFEVIEEMINDPEFSIALKIGVVLLIVGLVVLFVSLLRERLTLKKTDKYSREVQR